MQKASVQVSEEIIEDKQEPRYIKLCMRKTIQFLNSRGTGDYVRIRNMYDQKYLPKNS